MNSRKWRKWHVSRSTEYIEKIADLTFYDLWHIQEGDFLKDFTFEDKFAIIENSSFEGKFNRLKGLLHKCFQLHIYKIFLQRYSIILTLYCFFIVAISTWVVKKLLIALHHLRRRFCTLRIPWSHLYLLNHIVNGCIFGWSRHPFIFWA